MEALGRKVSRNIERLTGAIDFAALVIGGSMLLMTPMGGWHEVLGETMLVTGFLGIITIYIRALRRDPDWRRLQKCNPRVSFP